MNEKYYNVIKLASFVFLYLIEKGERWGVKKKKKAFKDTVQKERERKKKISDFINISVSDDRREVQIHPIQFFSFFLFLAFV